MGYLPFGALAAENSDYRISADVDLSNGAPP
jgi:hypothetical protein